MSEIKARVYVTLKPSVLDPQGKTIKEALESLGFKGIQDVRRFHREQLAAGPLVPSSRTFSYMGVTHAHSPLCAKMLPRSW